MFRLRCLAEALAGSLPPLQHAIITSIMVIDQQCYGITSQLLSAQIRSSHAFEWTQHMRFYWDDKKHTCYIKQANNTLPYGYEFLGLMPRDYVHLGSNRYLLSLSDSLRSALGCTVVGATESVDMIRELARCLGRLFASFCCTATAPSYSILRFLCAVTQTGAWGCFLVCSLPPCYSFTNIYLELRLYEAGSQVTSVSVFEFNLSCYF
jgi:hypothetical protein